MKQILKPYHIKVCMALIMLSGIFSSCKKLIEIPENPANQIPTGLLFTDSISVMGAVAGVYNSMGAASSGTKFMSGMISLDMGLSADELYLTDVYYEGIIQLAANTMQSDNVEALRMWTDAYQNIYQINACLKGITESTGISATLRQQLLGELKVVRALYYFKLVNIYGAVPLVTSIDYNQTMRLPRTPVEEVYVQIIKDLTEARSALNPSYPSAGRARPNVYVASALLAKVYLYQKQWAQAESMATSVISSDLFSLVPLENVFRSGSQEAIWQLPSNALYNQTPEAAQFVPYSSDAIPEYGITDQLLNSFETGDLRKEQWLGLSTVETGPNTFSDYHYPYKYKNRESTQTPPEAYVILRLADQYLIRAEARAEQNNVAGAVADLNLVRERSRSRVDALPDIAGNISRPDCLLAVARERRVELFCEWGNRWFDLKRTGTIDAVLPAVKPNWKTTAALFPIPYNQRLLNNALVQNPGYN